jgi:hypothetical protein
LQRQAGEWGEDYVFRSCADITLVKQSSFKGAKTVKYNPAQALLASAKLASDASLHIIKALTSVVADNFIPLINKKPYF